MRNSQYTKGTDRKLQEGRRSWGYQGRHFRGTILELGLEEQIASLLEVAAWEIAEVADLSLEILPSPSLINSHSCPNLCQNVLSSGTPSQSSLMGSTPCTLLQRSHGPFSHTPLQVDIGQLDVWLLGQFTLSFLIYLHIFHYIFKLTPTSKSGASGLNFAYHFLK